MPPPSLQRVNLALSGAENNMHLFMTGGELKTLSQSLQEAVDVLEKSLMRVEEQSHCTTGLNSTRASATVKLT